MVGRLGTVPQGKGHIIVGSGAVGRKSAGLLAEKGIIGQAGFVFPEFASVTPAFFRRFLEESGAAGKQGEAEKFIMQHEFTASEKEAIGAAALSFEPSASGRALMVRSDEWAGGSGIWKSCAVSAHVGQEKLFLERVFGGIKKVLASGFSFEAEMFRKRMGIEEDSGVMLMPVYGENVEVRGLKCIVPPIGMACMSKNGKGVYVTSGSGIEWMKRPMYVTSGYFVGDNSGEGRDALKEAEGHFFFGLHCRY